ncbi:hypothetical protein L1887_21770 [Cichorium endivia]|nr:hypothetical protein L1887_21770 [Cichorium endivia]
MVRRRNKRLQRVRWQCVVDSCANSDQEVRVAISDQELGHGDGVVISDQEMRVDGGQEVPGRRRLGHNEGDDGESR